jgi:hypothetical protein
MSDVPCGTGQTSQNQTLLVAVHLHDSGSFKLLPDPVALLQRVDEHELNTNVPAVGSLQTTKNFLQRQSFVLATNEGGGGQFEDTLHVIFI